MSSRNPHVGAGFKQFRLSLGLMQKEFAALLGVSKSFISEIETGRKNPNVELLTTLASTHNVDISYILTGLGTLFKETGEGAGHERRRRLLGEEMLSSISEIKYYLDNSTMAMHAIINFFKTYTIDKRKVLEEDVKRFNKLK